MYKSTSFPMPICFVASFYGQSVLVVILIGRFFKVGLNGVLTHAAGHVPAVCRNDNGRGVKCLLITDVLADAAADAEQEIDPGGKLHFVVFGKTDGGRRAFRDAFSARHAFCIGDASIFG